MCAKPSQYTLNECFEHRNLQLSGSVLINEYIFFSVLYKNIPLSMAIITIRNNNVNEIQMFISLKCIRFLIYRSVKRDSMYQQCILLSIYKMM